MVVKTVASWLPLTGINSHQPLLSMIRPCLFSPLEQHISTSQPILHCLKAVTPIKKPEHLLKQTKYMTNYPFLRDFHLEQEVVSHDWETTGKFKRWCKPKTHGFSSLLQFFETWWYCLDLETCTGPHQERTEKISEVFWPQNILNQVRESYETHSCHTWLLSRNTTQMKHVV